VRPPNHATRHPGAGRDPVLRSAKLALFCFITQVDDKCRQLDTARPRYDGTVRYFSAVGPDGRGTNPPHCHHMYVWANDKSESFFDKITDFFHEHTPITKNLGKIPALVFL
jgi:hypothetical protein